MHCVASPRVLLALAECKSKYCRRRSGTTCQSSCHHDTRVQTAQQQEGRETASGETPSAMRGLQMHVHIWLHTHSPTQGTYIHTRTHTRTHAHTHAHTHTHTDTDTHT